MRKEESIQENKTHKSLGDFEIPTDHQISPRRPDLVLISNKYRTCCRVNFAVTVDHRVKRKRNDRQILGPCNKTKKLWNMRVTVIPIVTDALETDL